MTQGSNDLTEVRLRADDPGSPEEARVRRFTEAIANAGWARTDADAVRLAVQRVMAVADAEQAELRAQNEGWCYSCGDSATGDEAAPVVYRLRERLAYAEAAVWAMARKGARRIVEARRDQAELRAELQRLTEERDAANEHVAYHLRDYSLNGEATGDLAVDMALYAGRMRVRVEAAERALADERAEVERLTAAAKTLGGIVHEQAQMALDATGRHDLIEADGDGDWQNVWEHLAELRPRLERAERALADERAKVARVEAEIERYRALGYLPLPEQLRLMTSPGAVVDSFAAALAGPEPATTHGPDCVHCRNGMTEFHRSRTDKPNPLRKPAATEGGA